jgi:choline dehydrogenase-like flavoprotein
MTSPSGKRYDALVIGSGAAGSIAVKELTERGLEVLLLEAGRDITEADFKPPPETQPQAMGISLAARANAGLHGQYTQARRAMFKSSTSPFLVNDLEHPYSTEADNFLWIRGQQLGGRLHSYGRMLLRSSDHEFNAASYDGFGENWPISYADVEPYYARIEEFIGIYGSSEGLDNLPDGKYVGQSRLSAAEEEFKAKVEGYWPGRHVIPWRYAAPNLHRIPLGILAARKTGRLTTRTDAVVKQITVDRQTGRADGAVFVDRLKKTEHRVQADVVVLCASTIESVRLLLNSACDGHPNGLGNSSGLLGRYFMDQTPSLLFASDPKRTGFERVDDSAPHDPFFPAAGGCYVPRFDNLDESSRRPFARGWAIQGTVGRIPTPADRAATVGLMGFGEMLPDFGNRISLHPKRTDKWGIPIPRIRISLSDNDRALLRQQVRGTREMAEYAGYKVDFIASTLGVDQKKIFPDRDPVSRAIARWGLGKSLAIGAAIHECGGARMGSDPARSVLNEYNQSWDVPNLFVTDGSSYVSTGAVGPTLTIMALTARASEHIAREHADGSLS